MKKIKILFVCTGNTCRSVIAEYIFNKLIKDEKLDDKIEAISCGTAAQPHYRIPDIVLSLFKKENINFNHHTPTKINRKLLEEADYVFTMEKAQKDYILNYYPEYKEKISLLLEFIDKEGEIYDPIGLPEEEYIKRFNEIKTYIELLVRKFVQSANKNH